MQLYAQQVSLQNSNYQIPIFLNVIIIYLFILLGKSLFKCIISG